MSGYLVLVEAGARLGRIRWLRVDGECDAVADLDHATVWTDRAEAERVAARHPGDRVVPVADVASGAVR